MKRNDTPPAVGGSSLLVIFIVLCLIVFALLSLSSVQADGRLSKAAAESVRAYYEADCEAEEVLAQLRQGTIPPEVTVSGNRYYYECTVTDTQKLVVEAEINDGDYRILRWQNESTHSWQEDETLQLWDGMTE